MAATVEIHYIDILHPVEVIECNYAKVKDGCVQIAYESLEQAQDFVSDYIPLTIIAKVKILTEKNFNKKDGDNN